MMGTLAALLSVAALIAAAPAAPSPTTASLTIRGREQTLHIYGVEGRPVAIVASGDGGWVHLGPQVAEYLAGQGWHVVGFDSKAYLSGFTTGRSTLSATDVPADFGVLVGYAAKGAPRPPVLVGVSEGAGLALLAAADSTLKGTIGGVVALGLPEVCELGWRFKDSLIYFTKGVPREPTFKTSEIIGNVAPVPVVAIHSTRDEFVTVDEVKRVMSRAGQPSQLWFVEAQDHRFSGSTAEFERKLLEALDWIRGPRP